MDLRELLSGRAPFVIDTSAWWRLEHLGAELAQALQEAIFEDRMPRCENSQPGMTATTGCRLRMR